MPFSSHHFDFLRMKSFRKPTIKVSTCNIKCIQGKLSKDWKLARMGVRPGNCTIITAVCPIVQGDLSSKVHSVCLSKGLSSQHALVEVFPKMEAVMLSVQVLPMQLMK